MGSWWGPLDGISALRRRDQRDTHVRREPSSGNQVSRHHDLGLSSLPKRNVCCFRHPVTPFSSLSCVDITNLSHFITLCDSMKSECTTVKSRKRLQPKRWKQCDETCYQVQVSVKVCVETVSSDCVSSSSVAQAPWVISSFWGLFPCPQKDL